MKSNMKYCCEFFKFRHEGEKEMGLNIRIVKLTATDVFSINDLNHPYRVVMTEGYINNLTYIKKSTIKYCPYCGICLNTFYNTDNYVNEKIENL
jgi:hypothetical protein